MYDQNLANKLKEGSVAVMPTDTIYGIVGRALDRLVVERIYDIKKRAPDKPFIILISDTEEIKKFSVSLSEEQEEKLKEYWFTLSAAEGPADSAQDFQPTSIILDCPRDVFSYLHRGTATLAFRMPGKDDLRELLRETGPLAAPSANPEGLPPAKNIDEAKKYFGGVVDLYIDGGEINGNPSKVIKLHKDGSITIIRQ